MTFTEKQTSILSHALLALFIFVCFRAGLDNFFAGDDYDWLFLALKVKHHPAYFWASQGFFVRYTEAVYFVLNFLVAGFHPVAYQFSALCIHVINVVLLSYLLGIVCKDRVSGFLGALFWGVNYKHVEVVFRPYGVADSLAMLFGVGAFLLFLRKRPVLAAFAVLIAAFGKENAVLFPLLMSIYVVVCLPSQRAIWLKRTFPIWGAAGFAGILGWYVRSKSTSYLTITLDGLSHFWELVLTYVGPDSIYIRQVWLSGAPTLIPLWLAILLCIFLVVLFWKLPNIYRFGILWIIIMTLPTVFVEYQSSRYYYIPLAGLGLIVGHLTHTVFAYCRQKQWQAGMAGVSIAFLIILVYYIVGINLEEQDYDYYGEIHRQAAESFKEQVIPFIRKDEGSMVVFPKVLNQYWAEELYAQVLSKPWYAPFTFKWVYRRSYAVLGLTNTYCFVSYCAYTDQEDTLFVNVAYDEFQQRILTDDVYFVIYDYDTNTFDVSVQPLPEPWRQHLDDINVYRLFQPGVFDQTNSGTPYL